VNILGLNAYHGDSAACLVVDGRLVAAAEEERFRRVKHWAGLPTEAVSYCLAEGGLAIGDVDLIAVNRTPRAHLLRKALFAFARRPSLRAVRDRLANAGKVADLAAALAAGLGADPGAIRARVHPVEHHRAHLASAFLVSPFASAAVASVDGFGDFVSGMWGAGDGPAIEVRDQVLFPHSLGLFYLAVTQHLGFPGYGDEYKVMGLAPYGEPEYLPQLRTVARLAPGGRYELDLDCFIHHSEGVTMVWDGGEPRIGRVFSPRLEELLGPARGPGEPLADRHRAIAASVQAMYEEALFHLLGHLQETTGRRALCLAGGCAMNSVANGKIFERTAFRDLWVPPAAGDAGGAVGAAFSLWNGLLGRPRSFVMDHAFWGPAFGAAVVDALLRSRAAEIEAAGCRCARREREEDLLGEVAARIAAGAVVGWFQGRMEWGPRALGNRSILCDPRRADAKELLNARIKRRESFRPFAPSILRERAGEWFETDYDVPFMLQVYQVRPGKRALIPAVTHVNGSGRLQTVTEAQNPRYWRLIREFERRTGVPALLNTSFNENEPVVCRPEEALDCFLRTKMDLLVLGDTIVERREPAPAPGG
jgi:carbamoyltransferase